MSVMESNHSQEMGTLQEQSQQEQSQQEQSQTEVGGQPEETLSLGELMLQERKKRKDKIRRKQQEASFRTYFNRVNQQRNRVINRINTELESLKHTIGSKDFNMLRDICTVTTPEQKNEAGEVTQKETKQVNKAALLKEARNLVVLKREERIKNKQRKKTSGRASKRKSHKNSVKFLTERNKEASKENR